MSDAKQLIDDAIAWLKRSYADHRFIVERDVVWTVQGFISRLIQERGLPHRIFNDFHDRKHAPDSLGQRIDWGNGTWILYAESSVKFSAPS